MPKIRILDDPLVSQIAAGEVVERPASVVKELLENALDAGATRIEVALEAGGKRSVRVRDDGTGMGRDDALLAFDRHATSKIASFQDLLRVGTLGFRGEALASIAAVARVELRTATQPGEGQRIGIEAGRIRVAEPTAHPRGTTVEVRSLFFNVPARREFLKAPRTELRRCTEVVQGYALARPEVGITLRHEDRLLLDTAPGGEGAKAAKQRISEVFGGDLKDHLVEIGSPPEAPERIWGFVGDPSTTRGRRYFTFVNRRLLRDRALMATFYRTVREQWKREDFPALFLFVDLPPEAVDVNVHPQKAEVRFRDPSLLDRLAMSLGQALGRGLGEGRAPLREPVAIPRAGFVWQGVGEASPGAAKLAARPLPAQVREPGGAEGPSPATLADVVYAPIVPRPVSLSGPRGASRRFRVLGQYKAALILLEGPESLYLIDQHAAHERVLYERLRQATLSERPVSQEFVEPLVLELAPAEAMHLAELRQDLQSCGFSLTELSGHSWALRSAPANLSPREAERLVGALVGDAGIAADVESQTRDRLLHALAASLSCRAAIKIHHPLTVEEMATLVEELFSAEQPFACPHGRPTVLEMTDGELERRFGRK